MRGLGGFLLLRRFVEMVISLDRHKLILLQTIGELSGRSKDRIVATGEKLACRVVVASLRSQVSFSHLIMSGYIDINRGFRQHSSLYQILFSQLTDQIYTLRVLHSQI